MAVKNNFNAFANNNTKPAKKRLMDNQDTAHKGDAGTDERKMITFYGKEARSPEGLLQAGGQDDDSCDAERCR